MHGDGGTTMQATSKVSKTIDAPSKDVWAALTDPAKLRKFMFGAEVKSDWKIGGAITFTGEMNGKKYADKGEIRDFEPERKLSYTHWSSTSGTEDRPENYHVVTYQLAPHGDQTDVSITQSNLSGKVTEADRKNREQYDKTWSTVLDGLAKLVSRGRAA